MIKVKRIRNGTYAMTLDGVSYVVHRSTSQKASGAFVDEWIVFQGDVIMCTVPSLKAAKAWLTPIVNQEVG